MSLSSSASLFPVDAPDGTAARPIVPFAKITSTSIVGFPLESKISRALTQLMVVNDRSCFICIPLTQGKL